MFIGRPPLGMSDWDSRMVRIFSRRMEQIAVHVKHEPGRFSTQSPHIDAKKRSGIEKGATHLLDKASLIGLETARWSWLPSNHSHVVDSLLIPHDNNRLRSG